MLAVKQRSQLFPLRCILPLSTYFLNNDNTYALHHMLAHTMNPKVLNNDSYIREFPTTPISKY
jgi:hypothetical protein